MPVSDSNKATEVRIEAAAVDQAIADVREVLALVRTYRQDVHGLYPISPQELQRIDATLRVLADAVEELRAETVPREFSITQQETIIELRERALAAEAERDDYGQRLVSAEDSLTDVRAERDRLARQVADLEEDRAISARMYRQLRDAVDAQKEATEEVDKLWEEHKRRMAARTAARSRDPQEPQT